MLISIVTPTLNARRYIEDCIDSTAAQQSTVGAIEHIIVDGGSTDGTAEYAESRNVRVLRGQDRGIFDAINRGSRAAHGEWLGFLGADDLMLKGALNQVVGAAQTTSARWMTGGVEYVDAEQRPLGRLQPFLGWAAPAMFACLGWSAVHHVATYLRRDFFDELGGYDIDYTVAADYELFCRAAALAPCHRIGGTLAAMRRTGTNFSARHDRLGKAQCEAIRQRYGPPGNYRQRLCREIARVWVNGANPTWSARKLFSRPY